LMVAPLRHQAIPYSSGPQQGAPCYHLVLLVK
jgi:hypothetical protein